MVANALYRRHEAFVKIKIFTYFVKIHFYEVRKNFDCVNASYQCCHLLRILLLHLEKNIYRFGKTNISFPV